MKVQFQTVPKKTSFHRSSIDQGRVTMGDGQCGLDSRQSTSPPPCSPPVSEQNEDAGERDVFINAVSDCSLSEMFKDRHRRAVHNNAGR